MYMIFDDYGGRKSRMLKIAFPSTNNFIRTSAENSTSRPHVVHIRVRGLCFVRSNECQEKCYLRAFFQHCELDSANASLVTAYALLVPAQIA